MIKKLEKGVFYIEGPHPDKCDYKIKIPIEIMVIFEEHLSKHPTDKCMYSSCGPEKIINCNKQYIMGDIYNSDMAGYLYEAYYKNIDKNVLEWLRENIHFYKNCISAMFTETDLDMVHSDLRDDIVKYLDGDLYVTWNQFNYYLEVI